MVRTSKKVYIDHGHGIGGVASVVNERQREADNVAEDTKVHKEVSVGPLAMAVGDENDARTKTSIQLPGMRTQTSSVQLVVEQGLENRHIPFGYPTALQNQPIYPSLAALVPYLRIVPPASSDDTVRLAEASTRGGNASYMGGVAIDLVESE
ncbi:hypothetical protein ARMGADRAFT_1034435 [Armillaria gallica]|uniref:Uncharacterized protein n=1 Tax=Armillaria gallica TaxID=47427 RepID=A0A2H3CXR2_ARMGA|nr:hypothetical protein ARMGADRAFT_1034435 [Armillaria gallica]